MTQLPEGALRHNVRETLARLEREGEAARMKGDRKTAELIGSIYRTLTYEGEWPAERG